jgi:hypothetical protein
LFSLVSPLSSHHLFSPPSPSHLSSLLFSPRLSPSLSPLFSYLEYSHDDDSNETSEENDEHKAVHDREPVDLELLLRMLKGERD